ncbi:hypothetical protein [Saccharomonospora marina]|uniref:hypothetical protein n=1 Tax=Saccharomonospora marina TaxID=632569 RepID=UPI001E347163|nr:hypothetical protein [Saccharomonospora marina]
MVSVIGVIGVIGIRRMLIMTRVRPVLFVRRGGVLVDVRHHCNPFPSIARIFLYGVGVQSKSFF